MAHATGLAGPHHLHVVTVLVSQLVPDFLQAVAGCLLVPELLAVSVLVPVLVPDPLTVSVLVPDLVPVLVPDPLSVFVVGRLLVPGRLQVVLLVVPLQLPAISLLLRLAVAVPPCLP